MAKRNQKQPVVISKQELLKPRMEFLPLNDEGQGFFVRELGGKALLEYRELIAKVQEEAGDGEISTAQSIELMVALVQMTACNEDGSPYFTPEEAEQFAGISIASLELAADKAMEMAGMNREAKNNLKNDQS